MQKKCDSTITLLKRATKNSNCKIAPLKRSNVQKCAKKEQIAQQARLGSRPF